MELLLNLIWAAFALSAFGGVLHGRFRSGNSQRTSRVTVLLALACVVVLLFPVVSATDDLHASQALAEDAIKRVQQGMAPTQHVNQFGTAGLFLSLLSLFLLFALVQSGRWSLPRLSPKPIKRQLLPLSGRSPPDLY